MINRFPTLGITPGSHWPCSTWPLAIFCPQILTTSRMIWRGFTADGCYISSLIPPICLNWGHSIFLGLLSLRLNILINALVTLGQLLLGWDVLTIDWMLSWAVITMSLDLTAPVDSVLRPCLVMNIMLFNACISSTFKSSVTSMFDLNHSSSQWWHNSQPLHNANSPHVTH